MKKWTLVLAASVLLLGGCNKSPTDGEADADPSPPITETVASTAEAATVSPEPPSEAAPADPIDAEQLLASTLEKAKAEDKRVLIHLGAPG